MRREPYTQASAVVVIELGKDGEEMHSRIEAAYSPSEMVSLRHNKNVDKILDGKRARAKKA